MPASAQLSQEEKEKQIRFERLSEAFTYLAVAGGVMLSFLPYEFPIDRRNFYIASTLISILALVWFRLIPSHYSGKTKNFLYSVLAIFFITMAVHFTRGILSVTVFLYYLVVLGAAASMSLAELAIVTTLAAFFICVESVLGFLDPSLGVKGLSMGVLRVWGLLTTVFFGWLVFHEEKLLKLQREETHLRKAKAVGEVKDEFVFIISSKLREPIASLQQYLKTAASFHGSGSKDTAIFLEKTQENSNRLETLVEDLSDLTKIEKGKLRLDIQRVDAGQVLGETLSDFALSAHEKDIKLVYEPPKEKIVVSADSGRLHEILANLVDNAIKYSDSKREIKVKVETKNDKAQIFVSDQGFGIPTEAAGHLFEKFYRVERPVQTKGTGLGLFITKQLVERQGGKIWFTSSGEGTTFIFSLPLADGPKND